MKGTGTQLIETALRREIDRTRYRSAGLRRISTGRPARSAAACPVERPPSASRQRPDLQDGCSLEFAGDRRAGAAARPSHPRMDPVAGRPGTPGLPASQESSVARSLPGRVAAGDRRPARTRLRRARSPGGWLGRSKTWSAPQHSLARCSTPALQRTATGQVGRSWHRPVDSQWGASR